MDSPTSHDADRKLAEELQRQFDMEASGSSQPRSSAEDEALAAELQERLNLELEFEQATRAVEANKDMKDAAKLERELNFVPQGSRAGARSMSMAKKEAPAAPIPVFTHIE